MAGVTCMIAKGDLPLDLFWTLNSQPLISGENHIVITKVNSRTSTLSIESLTSEHRGTYQCIARNRARFSQHSSELKVNGCYSFSIFFYFFAFQKNFAVLYFKYSFFNFGNSNTFRKTIYFE